MKRNLYLIFALWALSMISCTPDRYDVKEIELINVENIESIKLYGAHAQLLADGRAQMTFTPFFYTTDGYEITEGQIDTTQVEYYTTSGERISNSFSTSDLSLVGSEVSVYAKIKGSEIMSNAVSFKILDPAPLKAYTTITIPVIFHLLQSNNDILEYGGEIPGEKIYSLLDKMNYVFSGTVSRNAVGVDTKITFKAALYDPDGNLLQEPGINRFRLDTVRDKGNDYYKTLILEQDALWPYDKYLNIWLISDRDNEYATFQATVSSQCMPRYASVVADLDEAPEGLSLTSLPENWVPAPQEVGVLYKLQSTQTMVRSFAKSDNELINSIGTYLGLLPTYESFPIGLVEDYCDDTQDYSGYDVDGYENNITLYKLVDNCFFASENIMDDPVGLHRSISLQQSQRMRWVLNNCPERSAWKSTFAFEGH